MKQNIISCSSLFFLVLLQTTSYGAEAPNSQKVKVQFTGFGYRDAEGKIQEYECNGNKPQTRKIDLQNLLLFQSQQQKLRFVVGYDHQGKEHWLYNPTPEFAADKAPKQRYLPIDRVFDPKHPGIWFVTRKRQ